MSKRLLIPLSGLILLANIAFVVLAYYQTSSTLVEYLQHSVQEQRQYFQLHLETEQRQALHVASLLARNPQVKKAMHLPDNVYAQDEIKQQLAMQTQRVWRDLSPLLDALRVRFISSASETLLSLDYSTHLFPSLIQATNSQQQTMLRMFSIAPVAVTKTDGGQRVLGAVEVSAPMEEIYQHWQQDCQCDMGLAVLLNRSAEMHLGLQQVLMLGDTRSFEDSAQPLPVFFQESESTAPLKRFLSANKPTELLSTLEQSPQLFTWEDQSYIFTQIPWSFYIQDDEFGLLQYSLGHLLLWQNVSGHLKELQYKQLLNGLYMLIVGVLVLGLLWWSVQQIRRQSELQKQDAAATIKNLTAQVETQALFLQEANQQMVQEHTCKGSFLLNLGNELRSPLNNILGLCEALSKHTYGSLAQEQQRVIDELNDNGQYLLNLLNDVLDIIKIESGHVGLRKETLFVPELCQAVIQQLQVELHAKQINFQQRIAPEVKMLHGDQRRLTRALLILLKHAIYQAPEQGLITFSGYVTAQQTIAISIEDNGVEQKQTYLGYLDEPWTQAAKSSQLEQEHARLALGLMLAQRIARLHGGDIQVHRIPGPEKGGSVTLLLPL